LRHADAVIDPRPLGVTPISVSVERPTDSDGGLPPVRGHL